MIIDDKFFLANDSCAAAVGDAVVDTAVSSSGFGRSSGVDGRPWLAVFGDTVASAGKYL